MKYVHLRYHHNHCITRQNTEGILNLGGATIAYIVKDGEVWWTFAICREDENFSRLEGRRQCQKRMLSDDYYVYKYTGEFDASKFLDDVAKRRVYDKMSRSHFIDKIYQMGYPAHYGLNWFLY